MLRFSISLEKKKALIDVLPRVTFFLSAIIKGARSRMNWIEFNSFAFS